MRRDTLGKLVGLAGLAGVAATGVVIARDERERRAYSADDVRTRLHERAAAAAATPAPAQPAEPGPTRVARLRHAVLSRLPGAARRPRP